MVKHSKFKAYIVPFSRFDEYNQKLRIDNPKANHVVWAYRHYNEHFQIVENSSDDGEPKNSSAPPVLNVLRGEEMINCAVLIVRYFGGVKLGIGGLVRAYKNAAWEVLKKSSLQKYEMMHEIKFECIYSEFSKVEYLFKEYNLQCSKKEFGAMGVNAVVKVPHSIKDEVVQKLTPLIQDIKTSDIKQ